MSTRGIKLGEEVTITLPAEQWDALLRGKDRNWADGLYVYADELQSVLDEAGLDLHDLRGRAQEKIELATPGAASRRAIVKGLMESVKAELDRATQRELTKLVKDCIKQYQTRKRGNMHDSPEGWDHLGYGDTSPGGNCGRNDAIGVRIIPGIPHLCISRKTPHFDRGLSYNWSEEEIGLLEDCIKKAGGRNVIDRYWGGGEWVTFRLKIDHPNYPYSSTPDHG